MAKNKRKPSAAQRDKTNIQIAIHLKKAGILSKQANLRGGYISRDVLAKVRKYEDVARLGYTSVAVPKKDIRSYVERDYMTVAGNRVIGPATPQFRNRVKKGMVTGVRPVKGGMMEEVIMPHTVYDMQSLARQLEEGIDTLKMPDEQFAFKYKGWESYRAFPNTEMMLNYLKTYRGIFDIGGSLKAEDLTDEFANLTIFRMHVNSVGRNLRSVRQRTKDRAEMRAKGLLPRNIQRRHNRKSRAEKAEMMTKLNAERYLAQQAKKDKEKRDKIMRDPAKAEAYRIAARARAKAQRERNK